MASRALASMPEVDEVVAELRPDQELGGEVAGDPDLARGIGLHRRHPTRQHAVAHAVGECHVPVVRGGDCRIAGLQADEVVDDVALQRVGIQPASCGFGAAGCGGARAVGHGLFPRADSVRPHPVGDLGAVDAVRVRIVQVADDGVPHVFLEMRGSAAAVAARGRAHRSPD